MIAQFPEPYDDELLYSVLSRYYVRSGHWSLRDCMRDLFGKIIHPSIEFMDMLTKNVAVQLGNPTNIVLNHTMFANYARFIPLDRRKKALESIISGTKGYTNLLYIPKSDTSEMRYLRYCPICVSEDRVHYGEAYWHRSHQVYGVTVCSKHKCHLNNSDVWIHSKASPSLIAADIAIPVDETALPCEDEKALLLNQYMIDVFLQPLEIDSPSNIGKFLKYHLIGTEYLSFRGEHIWADKLCKDMLQYYSSITQTVLTDSYQISKVLMNKYCHPMIICMIGQFVGLDAETLSAMEYDEYSYSETIDKRIVELHSSGLNYRQISDIVGGSYDYVKTISYKKSKA